MDQRELDSRIKALTKSVAANEAPENALRLLESLKKDAAPTEEMLRVCECEMRYSAPSWLRCGLCAGGGGVCLWPPRRGPRCTWAVRARLRCIGRLVIPTVVSLETKSN